MSFEAVATLRTLGFDARRLEEGLPEWKATGLPIAFGGVERLIAARLLEAGSTALPGHLEP
jgi:hypothetical protein